MECRTHPGTPAKPGRRRRGSALALEGSVKLIKGIPIKGTEWT
jgi:hypothetical protein